MEARASQSHQFVEHRPLAVAGGGAEGGVAPRHRARAEAHGVHAQGGEEGGGAETADNGIYNNLEMRIDPNAPVLPSFAVQCSVVKMYCSLHSELFLSCRISAPNSAGYLTECL